MPHELDSIENLLTSIGQGVDQKTLVLLDLDNTVFMTKGVPDRDGKLLVSLGGDAWFSHFFQTACKDPASGDALQKTLALYKVLQSRAQFELVEDETAFVIEQMLGKPNVYVLGLTARSAELQPETSRALQSLGVTFSRDQINEFVIDIGSKKIMSQGGVIYCSGVDKGTVLEYVLRHIFKPEVGDIEHVTFVDDSQKNCHSVDAKLSQMKVPHFIYHYPKVRESYTDEHSLAHQSFLSSIFSQPEPDALRQQSAVAGLSC